MDAMNLLGLTCAVLAALAFGVLLAYSCCQALFAMLRMHSPFFAARIAEQCG